MLVVLKIPQQLPCSHLCGKSAYKCHLCGYQKVSLPNFMLNSQKRSRLVVCGYFQNQPLLLFTSMKMRWSWTGVWLLTCINGAFSRNYGSPILIGFFSQLKEFWDKYWNCPDGVMLDKVPYPVDSIPALPPLDCSVSSNDVLEAIKDLPVKKARGMDGWSSAELKLLSKEDTEVLVSLYNSVPETGESPIQLCQAVVTLLAKVENPESPKDGRPITVLPVLYRLFAKIMAKIFVLIGVAFCHHRYLAACQDTVQCMLPGN